MFTDPGLSYVGRLLKKKKKQKHHFSIPCLGILNGTWLFKYAVWTEFKVHYPIHQLMLKHLAKCLMPRKTVLDLNSSGLKIGNVRIFLLALELTLGHPACESSLKLSLSCRGITEWWGRNAAQVVLLKSLDLLIK